jgi:hypothetical protein
MDLEIGQIYLLLNHLELMYCTLERVTAFAGAASQTSALDVSLLARYGLHGLKSPVPPELHHGEHASQAS